MPPSGSLPGVRRHQAGAARPGRLGALLPGEPSGSPALPERRRRASGQDRRGPDHPAGRHLPGPAHSGSVQ
eukprot:9992102-Alexandrium_andersonii.AAC.1